MRFYKNTSLTRRFSSAQLFGQTWIWFGPVRIVVGPQNGNKPLPELFQAPDSGV